MKLLTWKSEGFINYVTDISSHQAFYFHCSCLHFVVTCCLPPVCDDHCWQWLSSLSLIRLQNWTYLSVLQYFIVFTVSVRINFSLVIESCHWSPQLYPSLEAIWLAWLSDSNYCGSALLVFSKPIEKTSRREATTDRIQPYWTTMLLLSSSYISIKGPKYKDTCGQHWRFMSYSMTTLMEILIQKTIFLVDLVNMGMARHTDRFELCIEVKKQLGLFLKFEATFSFLTTWPINVYLDPQLSWKEDTIQIFLDSTIELLSCLLMHIFSFFISPSPSSTLDDCTKWRTFWLTFVFYFRSFPSGN